MWIVAIKRTDPVTKKLWEPGPHDRVCRDHFTSHDYTTTLLGERSRLKTSVVPSIFKFASRNLTSPSALRRRERSKRKLDDSFTEVPLPVSDDIPDVGQEVTIMNRIDMEDESALNLEGQRSVRSECHLLTNMNYRFSIKKIEDNPRAIKYYTGMNNYDHFMLITYVLGPAANHLNYKCSILTHEDQLFLTLMKLRQAKEDVELSILFHVSESTVSQIISTWINFLYFQLKELDIWPAKSTVQDHMPLNFGKQFKSTRVVLDATEVPVAKPKNVNAQSVTYSTYKSKNTFKTMIGCTPRGLVSHISDSYGGSASDRQLIERSPLCSTEMFDKGDSIMADRGIMIQDLFACTNVFVNTPTMLKGKSQLEPETVVRDRRVSSKRIHVERVIGLGKTYNFLKKELPASKRVLGSRIIYICYILSNFRPSIVNRLA